MKRGSCLLLILCCLAAGRLYAQHPALGDAVITCGTSNHGDPVLATIGVQNASLQPLNTNWAAPMYHDPRWNSDTLGQIFGIALDGNGNIYVTATIAYPARWFGPGGAGAVYRISAVTGAVSLFATLPSTSAASLGNICWDPDHNPSGSTNGQFFVTNLEDGKIYRINGSTGAIINTFDPFVADGGTPGLAPRGERLWGIGYSISPTNTPRVYFGRWQEDYGIPSASVSNEIHSVGLIATGPSAGDFDVAGGTVLEITLSTLVAKTYSNPPSDIEFSASGRMLVSERGWYTDDNSLYTTNTAHTARLLEYRRSGAIWVAGSSFGIGAPIWGTRDNSAGGNDYGYRTFNSSARKTVDCDSVVWSSGYALHFTGFDGFTDKIYGEQMLPATGGTPANSVLIDLDGSLSDYAQKNYIGDIDIFKNCVAGNPCDSISQILTSVLDPEYGCCSDLSINNGYQANFWLSIHVDILTPGVTFTTGSAPVTWTSIATSSTSLVFAPATGMIPLGVSGPLHFCLNPGATTTQSVRVTWFGKNGVSCSDTLTIRCTKPEPCGELFEPTIKCLTSPPAAPSYSLTFSVNNLTTGTTFATASVSSTTMGVTVTTPTFSFPALWPATISTAHTVTVTGGAPGSTACFTFTMFDAAGKVVCTFDSCLVLPRCKSCCDSLRLVVNPPVVGPPVVNPAGTSTVTVSTVLTSAPIPLTRFTATITSATQAVWHKDAAPEPEKPVAAVFNGGSLAGVDPSTPAGTAELTWGTYDQGVQLQQAPLALRIVLPDRPIIRSTDTVTIWTKYTYTDTNCRTCDTMICSKVIRSGVFVSSTDIATHVSPRFGADEDPDKGGRGGEVLSFGTSGKPIYIEMSSETAGTLRIENPALLQGDDPNSAVTIVGLEMEPEVGINLSSMQAQSGNQQSAVVADRVAAISTLAIPIGNGSNETFDLVYTNTMPLTAFANYLKLYYTLPNSPAVHSATVIVYARTPNGQGGDVFAADPTVTLQNVRTYAFRFDNGNTTGDRIARVELSVDNNANDGDDIVAVGPGIDRLKAGLKSFRTTEVSPRLLLLAEEPRAAEAGAYPLVTGDSVKPIFVTFCGGADDEVELDYTTFNDKNEVVSTGTITADAPLRAGRAGLDDPTSPGTEVVDVACVPNPATRQTTFTFRLRAPERAVWLSITDMNGAEVARVIDGVSFAAGEHRVVFDASTLPAGAYLYTFRGSRQSQTRRMNIVR